MAEMKIGGGGVDTELDGERTPRCELRQKRLLGHDVRRTARDGLHLVRSVGHP